MKWMLSHLALALWLAMLPTGQVHATEVSLGLQGIEIDAGAAGRFQVDWPRVVAGKDQRLAGDVVVGDDRVVAKYPQGGQVAITLRDGGIVQLHFTGLPVGVETARIRMKLAGGIRGTLQWSANGSAPLTVPATFAGKPFLFQGDAKRFSLVHPDDNSGFAIVLPHGFQQFQDNRQWNSDNYEWFALIKLPPAAAGEAYVVFAITAPTASAPELKAQMAPAGTPAPQPPKPAIMIDRYGQYLKKEYPGKVASEQELKDDAAQEKAYYDALRPPALDEFGGLPGSGEALGLKKTGFFHIETVSDRQILVDPAGNAFFQLGVCGALVTLDDYTFILGRQSIYAELPDFNDPVFKTAYRDGYKGFVSFYVANTIRKYGRPFDPETHARRMLQRLRGWGFNSAGAWGSTPKTEPVIRENNFPYVEFLPLGDAPKLPVKSTFDPFADGLEEKLDAAFAKSVAARASDPLLIGWFISNEPLIEDLPKVLPTLKASKFAVKRRLVEELRKKYPTIEAFNAAWGANLASLDDVGEASLSIATQQANADMQAFFKLFLEARYSLVNRLLRKHDPNHLLIGDRWMPGTANNEALVSIAGKYLDVVSINYYAYGVDKPYLDRIHAWSGGKPLIFTEFHYGCRDQGLGGGVRQVANQTERGLAYRNYVEQAAATGYVVGIQWFSALDQATTGRFFEGFNGEAHNIGLLNVVDRPYKEMLAEVTRTNYDIYPVLLGQREPFRFDDPRFTLKRGGVKVVQVPRMVKPFVLDGSRTEWPSSPPERVGADGLVLGENADGFDGTFRVAWDDRNLYLYAEVSDPTPMLNDHRNGAIWLGDCVELFTGADNLLQGGSLTFGDRQVLLRGAKSSGELVAAVVDNAPKPFSVQSHVIPGVDGKGYAIEAAIPLEALGFQPAAGKEILFDIAFNDGNNGARRQLVWNGTAQNSKDRSGWGRAQFTD